MHNLNFMCNFRHNCGKQQKQHASGHNLSQFEDIKCMYSGWVLLSVITSFFPKIMCSYIHKLMNPDEDFTAVIEYKILFPVTLKVMMVVTNVQSNIWPLAQNKHSALLNSSLLKEYLFLLKQQLRIWSLSTLGSQIHTECSKLVKLLVSLKKSHQQIMASHST